MIERNPTLSESGNNGFKIEGIGFAEMDKVWRSGVIEFPFCDYKRHTLSFTIRTAKGDVNRSLWLVQEMTVPDAPLSDEVRIAMHNAIFGAPRAREGGADG